MTTERSNTSKISEVPDKVGPGQSAENDTVGGKRPYQMTISLNVLEHLGIGLYSNVPAVLSEIVANSWDADATEVSIDIKPAQSEIVITDNGIGMTRADINKKYLTVGYRKREQEKNGGVTQRGRAPMGRKGIGKLSVFSIAETVDVYSIKDGEISGLRMSASKIKEQIEKEQAEKEQIEEVGSASDSLRPGIYYPEVLEPGSLAPEKGTRIVLRNVKKKLSVVEDALRKRLARRFSMIGATDEFCVIVNDKPISAKDRDYYDYVEFLWYFGKESEHYVAKCKNVKNSVQLPNVVNVEKGYKVEGWIGTIDEQKNVNDENNKIVVYARGKLVQEDILGDFKEGGVYTKYLTGDIDADFLDRNEEEDIVTSNRQSVQEDDPRYADLKEFTQPVLKTIQTEWSKLRKKAGVERALTLPTIKAWYEQLEGDNKRYAGELFGKLESLKIADQETRKELYRASLLAFEKLALKHALSTIDQVQTEDDFRLLGSIFNNVDEVEAVHYYQIAKGRLAVLREFERILPESQEKIIQRHIFDHLWLLHASWERASTNERIEQSVMTEFAKITAKLTKAERDGRIDIRYKTAAGKHIIVELKRYSVTINVYDLAKQLSKYRNALAKCLREQFPEEPKEIECISILGKPPDAGEDPEEVRRTLEAIRARFITYDQLIKETQESYRGYLDKEKKISELIRIIESLDAEFATGDGAA